MSKHPHKFNARAAANAARLDDKIKEAQLGDVGPLEIWVVKGRVIRDNVFIDFTEGGNSAKYHWMPHNTIYLDTDVDQAEQRFVKLHELHEFNKMKGGLGYERAHDSANLVEQAVRDDPRQYRELWQAEVDKLMVWALATRQTMR